MIHSLLLESDGMKLAHWEWELYTLFISFDIIISHNHVCLAL